MPNVPANVTAYHFWEEEGTATSWGLPHPVRLITLIGGNRVLIGRIHRRLQAGRFSVRDTSHVQGSGMHENPHRAGTELASDLERTHLTVLLRRLPGTIGIPATIDLDGATK